MSPDECVVRGLHTPIHGDSRHMSSILSSQVKYYKGLGTSTSKEAKEYFSDMDRHRVPFQYAGAGDDEAILLVRVEE